MTYLKSESKILIGFYTLVLFFSSFFMTSVLSDEEGAYMLKLMNALKPPGWSNTTHMCQWTGVSCNNQSRRIEEIFLKEMSLTGTVPAGLNDSLSQLTYLYLSYNNLSGPVPSLANLSFLQVAYLDNNNFTTIPHGCFHGLTSLQSLLLNNNTNLPPWNFPTDLTAHSSQLDVLDLSSTNLMGSVPNISHSFPTLRYLSLSNNNLSSIPEDCFHNLTSLDVLSLANNTNLPPWTFPLDLTHSSFKLSYLDLQATNLMGSLPNLSHFFPDLNTISLSNNNLTFIPQGCFQALPYLGMLKLGNNTNLRPWTFPDLIQSTKIEELNLVATNVMGSLPEIFDSLTSLETLLLSNNSLTGVLPQSFGRSKITTLHLNDQKGKGFSGVVPDSLINLSRRNLQTVTLNNNFFQGPMPNILGDSDSTNLGDNTTNAFCRDDYDPCDERVTILLEIASAFGYPYLLARSWRGNNPCHNWSFVACAGGLITTVNLTRQNLTGTISDAFGKLIHLENLYLSGNNLSGSIPENLTSLHQLNNLDVSNNNLSGKIPDFSRGVNLNTEGNPSFERRKPSGKRRNPPAWIKGAIAAAAGIGGLVFLVIVICNRKRCLSLLDKILWKKTGPFIDNEFEEFMKTYGSLMLRRYNYSEVKSMTNSFRDKLGKGGYGIVYKAYLRDGCPIAVKVLTESSGSGEEFLNEVASIGRTSHMNIVSLLGFCYEKYKRALIYEFMPNGSLDKFIYKQESPNAICNLDWNTLFQITIGIARGLEYLHRGCAARILHLDIKPQNILLDEDFCPKIADFGLAKICKKKESIVSLQGTRGTPGYIAPEVFSRTFGKVSHKSDVYSYGMLILELVGGRKNYDTGGSLTSEMYFPDWIYKDLEEQNVLGRGLSTTEEESDMIKKITLVSLWCIQTNPLDRPSINKVVEMLEGPLQSVPYPPKPVLYSPQMSISQFSRISYNSTDEEDSEIVEETISINKMSSKFAK
ncbi:receptor-like kinase TMK4 isoform X2 [Arachis stenosperma]|uniref:receptor-like kinase TMK4 isoform X2 n=1 Tax=Arachis stenosperma TaxID=217475 RepID=UPI0025ABFFD9|nr:receptor-like kinase TMK4 isoform X2 [Arachis stenosperma]